MEKKTGIREKIKDAALSGIALPLKAVPLWMEAIGAGLFVAEVVEKNPRFKKRLDGIDGKIFLFEAKDIGKGFYLHIKDREIKVVPHMSGKPDVKMKGEVKVLVEVLLGRVDPDTVFFSRKLEIEGDTASAIYLKNLLASLE